jgi:electron transport complex protein RnfG
MKDIITIIFRLTVSCLIAGLIMGTTFIFTNKAKKANEHAREEKVIYSLLGYSQAAPIPDSIGLHEIFRYVVSDGASQSIGYLVPVGAYGKEEGFSFIRLNLDGEHLDTTPVNITEEKVREEGDRNGAIAQALGADKTIRAADQTIVVTDHGQRTAYLLSGKFPGFKTNIAIILALNPEYSVIGFEVMEHEEDPGLGAEIVQEYFKNQFKYKEFEKIKNLEVVKAPLPPDYFEALTGRIAELDAIAMLKQYKDQDIYALTGATISTEAVSSGVKGMTKKFAYRLDILDNVLREQQIEVPF